MSTLMNKLREVYDLVSKDNSARLSVNIDETEYIRNFKPKERLVILGGGHISLELCRYASDLGFSVTVVDDRPGFAHPGRFPDADKVICNAFSDAIEELAVNSNDYVAVVTRGHRFDADCLRGVLSGVFPKYLGMIGSRRRVAALLQLLEEEGFSGEDLGRIHTPIGLDIGAVTVKEIAISIVAELIQCRRAAFDRRSKEKILTAEDIDIDLLKYLACDETPKAFLMVYETSGSTPAKSGAMMAIDKGFRTVGTIGGGCSENAVLQDAFRLIGTGEQIQVSIDMSNDVAEDEGMVCGGSMKVFIADVN